MISETVTVQETPVISIVDDDESVREGLADLVRSMGFTAEVFRGAGEFLKSPRNHISCLIADIKMPGMTGLDLRADLARSGDNIPTILVTAFPNERDRALALQAGVTCYLAKPFSEDALLACIRSALSAGRS